MRTLNAIVIAMLAASACAQAQTEQDHSAHHPAVAAAASSPTNAKATARKVSPAASAPTRAPAPAQMDAQMRAMRDMHEKMMAAKTPDERQALMAEHMKAMQDGMAMMDQMQAGAGGDGGMRMRHEMMGKRMDMMQMMMEMMMDRDANPIPAAK